MESWGSVGWLGDGHFPEPLHPCRGPNPCLPRSRLPVPARAPCGALGTGCCPGSPWVPQCLTRVPWGALGMEPAHCHVPALNPPVPAVVLWGRVWELWGSAEGTASAPRASRVPARRQRGQGRAAAARPRRGHPGHAGRPAEPGPGPAGEGGEPAACAHRLQPRRPAEGRALQRRRSPARHRRRRRLPAPLGGACGTPGALGWTAGLGGTAEWRWAAES